MSLTGHARPDVEQTPYRERRFRSRFVAVQPPRTAEPGLLAGDMEDILDGEAQPGEWSRGGALERDVIFPDNRAGGIVEGQVHAAVSAQLGRRSWAGSRWNVMRPRLKPISGGDNSATADS